jgi:hypothetical protein
VPSSLIIACDIHDLGMTVDPGPKHGHLSAELCREFLAQNNLDEKEFPRLLEAIINHDNKEYRGKAAGNDLLTLLCISDDLDAFGCAGIYRYTEIYSVRGIGMERIGRAIRDNASGRYRHFAETFSFDEKITEKHRKKYEVLDNFFSEYEKQLPFYSPGMLTGHCGVVEILMITVSEKADLEKTVREYANNADPVIRWYFTELIKELYNQ